MNIEQLIPTFTADNSATEFSHQRVVAKKGHDIILNNGKLAKQGLSTLVQVEVHDLVLVSSSNLGCYIISVLDRPERAKVNLSVPGSEEITVAANDITLVASNKLKQFAGERIQLACPTGSIYTQAKNMVQTVTDNIIQTANRLFSRSQQVQLEAQELMTLRTEHGLVEARKDLRMNAEHINMG